MSKINNEKRELHFYYKNEVKIKAQFIDAASFLQKYKNKVDLIFTDPPFGIGGDKLDNVYNRDNNNVVKGYQEAPSKDYEEWAYEWIKHLDKALKPSGSVVIISGWTHEADIQHAMKRTGKFELVNQLIWKFNFGVHTKRKFVTSHYVILWYCKKGAKPYFNKNAYHDDWERKIGGGSAVYDDLQSVISIDKEYRRGRLKYQNQLPSRLVEKLIKHLSEEGDLVVDPFAGSFTIPFIAMKLNRQAHGNDINEETEQLIKTRWEEYARNKSNKNINC